MYVRYKHTMKLCRAAEKDSMLEVDITYSSSLNNMYVLRRIKHSSNIRIPLEIIISRH